MSITLLAYTPNPDSVVATAAKLCYSGKALHDVIKESSEKDNSEFIERLVSLGHHSPFEHVSFTFAIDGVSRSFLAQITRHRIASYSVASQRYISGDKFSFVLPKDITTEQERVYDDAMKKCWDAYDTLIAMGAEKEDARAVLPNACTTQMIITMNARSLMNFFSLRSCNRAQKEIRDVSDEMMRLCKEVSPLIFKNAGPSCVNGKCSEGKMSCGKPRNFD